MQQLRTLEHRILLLVPMLRSGSVAKDMRWRNLHKRKRRATRVKGLAQLLSEFDWEAFNAQLARSFDRLNASLNRFIANVEKANAKQDEQV